jgi:hypothetical protein
VIELLRHQRAVIEAPFKYPDVDYFFFSGGYGCGKSFTIVTLFFTICQWWQGCYLTIGIGGAAIKHLKETVIKDVCRMMDMHHIPYKHNGQEGVIIVGTLTFVYFSLDRPDTIFGHNLSAILADEGGELTDKMRFQESAIASQERNRVTLPITPAVKNWHRERGIRTPSVKDPRDGSLVPGRNPFFISTTTAQGYDGVWTFMRYLEDHKVPFVRIRAKTKDNWHNSAKQIENLYALYTEDEAAVFLEGEYRNLTTGRVYAEYDDKRNLYMPFELQEDEHIYVGQDFNTGYNGAVVCIVRGEHIYCVGEHHWDVVGDAPRQLRLRYPKNKITFIPDVSGKEIMRGWMDEFDNHEIECHWDNVNPSISDRILALNKLCRLGQFHVFPSCKKLSQGLLLRGFDDSGKPEKGKGPHALDHHCDAAEYAVWHIIHSLTSFDKIIQVLKHNFNEDSWRNAA